MPRNSRVPERWPAKPETASTDAKAPVNGPLTFTLKLDPEHPHLTERGLAPATIETFGLGYCSRGHIDISCA